MNPKHPPGPPMTLGRKPAGASQAPAALSSAHSRLASPARPKAEWVAFSRGFIALVEPSRRNLALAII